METKEIQKLIGKMQVLKFHIVCENIHNFLGEADVLSISKSNMVYEFEVKISKSDFKADKNKHKFAHYAIPDEDNTPNYFSYVCPEDLISINEIPIYAGLFYVVYGELIQIKSPKRIHKLIHKELNLLHKICRINSERQYLGMCRLTFENKTAYERNQQFLINAKKINE